LCKELDFFLMVLISLTISPFLYTTFNTFILLDTTHF
jgi:hypothetical protein